MPQSKIEQINALLKSIETGEPGPVAVVNDARYIQHNPQTHEGSEGLAALFERISKTGPKVNMVRGFEDGDYVFAHMEYDFATRKICFEVFRCEDGQAVEHWDNIQERTGPNVSGHSMVDGTTHTTDLDLTEQNRTATRTFVETVLIGGKTDQLPDFLNAESYIEHNPHLSGDITGLQSALSEQQDGKRAINYQHIHRILAQGSFVLSVCEGEKNGNHTAFYDLCRLEAGKIVEHWDTTETVAPKDQWKNDNGKF